MTMTFSTRSRLERVLYTRESPHGTPYAVGLATNSDGQEHTVLACSKRINLDHLRLLEGQDLALQMTESGPQVKPLSEQPRQVQEHLFAALEAGEGQRSSELKIPHLPRPAPEAIQRGEDATHGQHGTHLPKISELAVTVAHLAQELGVATAMWVHLPPD
jgi:hypothetical protein